jgi:hypothetical protein
MLYDKVFSSYLYTKYLLKFKLFPNIHEIEKLNV